MTEDQPSYETICCRVGVDSPDVDHSHWSRPKCPECGCRSGAVRSDLQRSVAGHHCPVADLPSAPARLRAYQHAIAWALERAGYLDKQRVMDHLDLPDSKAKSVQRGLRDARDAGWIELTGQTYSRGPLADIIVQSRTSHTEGSDG